MENLAGQGLGWVPTAGNIITGACYLGCLALSSKLDQSLDAAIVVLAPILLLLNQVRPLETCTHILLLPNLVKPGELLACHAAAGSDAFDVLYAQLLLTQGAHSLEEAACRHWH